MIACLVRAIALSNKGRGLTVRRVSHSYWRPLRLVSLLLFGVNRFDGTLIARPRATV